MSNLSEQATHLKAAIYVRVSTHWQVDKDSLQVQKRELPLYAEMVLNVKDYEIFEDPGFSAKNTERPAFQEMMNRLRTGEFSHLLVWKIDRISRNLLDFSQMYAELKSLGITFVSKNEQFDTSSAIGEAMLKIILVFAELERNMTSERVKAVMVSRASNGQWNGGRVPYGYAWDKDTLSISVVEAEKQTINLIWDKYEESQSLLAVTRFLNENGMRTRSGKLWSAPSIHKILTSKFYIGSYVYNMHDESQGWERNEEDEWIVVEDHHPSIIDSDRFYKMQMTLKSNRRGNRKSGDTYQRIHTHVLAGIVRCGICGSNMTATPGRKRSDGWRPSTFGCSMRRKGIAICSNSYVTEIKLTPVVFSFLRNMIKAKDSTSSRTTLSTLQTKLIRGRYLSDVSEIPEQDLRNILQLFLSGASGIEYNYISSAELYASDKCEVDKLKAEKAKKESALNRLHALFLYSDSSIPESEYLIEREKISREISDIDNRIEQLDAEQFVINSSEDEFVRKASYFTMVSVLTGSRSFEYERFLRNTDSSIQKAFLKTVLDNIEVINGKVVSITLKNGVCCHFLRDVKP